MAEIELTSQASPGLHAWLALASGDTGTPLELPSGGDQLAVQVGGTLGGTVTIQASIDGSTWHTLLTSPGGDLVTFSAAGYAEITTAMAFIRPSAGSGVSAADVYLRVQK